MKLKDLKYLIDSQIKLMKSAEDTEVVIMLHNERAIGPATTVPVEQAMLGFDWNSGFYLLKPSSPVVPADRINNLEACVMIRVRNMIRKKCTNRGLYMMIFGAGWDVAERRCEELGLDPDSYGKPS